MKREQLTAALRTAGYHDDTAAFTRLLVENRIAKDRAQAAYDSGRQARAAGVRCDCDACKAAAPNERQARAGHAEPCGFGLDGAACYACQTSSARGQS